MVIKTEVANTLVFYVNGKKVEDRNVDPEWTLLYYLRKKLRLCGTKLGCGEGGCGACTVMVSKFDRKTNKEVHLPVNSCLAPVCSMHGLAVTTVEGIGSTRTKLHPVQERLAKAHGSQCGFCTPGIVMSMYTLLRNKPKPSMGDLEVALQGNLCRCTGYRAIIEGFRTFTEEWEVLQNGSRLTNGTNGCAMGEKCCKLQNGTSNGCSSNGINGENDSKDPDEVLFKPSEFTPYHPSQEPIFPPELKLTDKYDKQYLKIGGPKVTWYRPTTLKDLLNLKKQYPDAKVVVGNTEVGVETKFKNMLYPVIIQPVLIEELVKIEEVLDGVKIGASSTLMDIEAFLRERTRKYPKEQTRIYQGIIEMLNWFAGKQIRSVGALGGNIMTGSPISDMIPILMAVRAEMEVISKDDGIRKVRLDDTFFTGYRKTVVKPNEILLSILVPFTNKDHYFQAYKQARRREDDIAIVNTAVNVKFEPNTNTIKDLGLAFGGMSFKTLTAPKTEQKLKGLPWNRDTLELAYTYLLEDLPLDPSSPGGMIQYRKSLTLSLFFKAFLAISAQLQEYVPAIDLDKRERSAIEGFHGSFDNFKSAQYFRVVPSTQEKTDALQRPIVHASAFKQAAGEAVYCDDLPAVENELYLAFVTSTRAHANILSIDPSKALEIKGVHGIVSAEDIRKNRRHWGSVVHDENVFYTDKVTAQGQIIAAVVADDLATAQRAAKAVRIEYQDLEPVIVSIEDAIKHKSFFADPLRVIAKGDIEKVLKEAPHVYEGTCRMGGQEHFYFETQCVLVIPKPEDDEIEHYSSTQNPTEVSKLIGEVLGLPQSKVIGKVKRLGGGFGGKESKAAMIAIPTAVAAKKFRRPIRTMLDRDEDIVMTGGRHPFLMKYKVAFDDDGKILGCEIDIYCNCGYSIDLSFSVLERAMTHFENSYNIPVVKVTGYPCKTNLPSNTAFRGFGGPQGMYAGECIVNDIATYLKKDPIKVREINLFKEGDVTHYSQILENCTLDKCWKECVSSSSYFERRKQVNKFNRENKYKKRGLSIIPTMYGISFTALHLNQAGALVLVYSDGSVLLHHGGIEMGQGLYTKMIQVASRVLEIPAEKIHTSDTGTDRIPNASPTAASSGSDLNGMAVLEACKTIKERLRPIKEKNPKDTWEEIVRKAYFSRVCLSATGFYKTPDLGFNWETGIGKMYNYFTYGVACTEVKIDTLTGDHKLLRTDIVMDLGESLNPAIDIGQIEGAFIQGYGLFVLEELMYSPTGTTFTRGPGTYKIPGFADIPAEFNVSLLKGVSNPRAVYSSKAVGEPPLFLASAALFAIKDAIAAARIENGYSPDFRLDAPATSARIRMACQDDITRKLQEPKEGTFKPWNITA